jgi:hypothetical protein
MPPNRHSSTAIPIRLIAYLWAAPVSLVGLALAVLAKLTGGRMQFRHGILESYGGLLSPLLRGSRFHNGGAGMTLGHVSLARNADCLARSRAHESAHVRQFERWGPLLLPAYWLVGLWLRLRGYDAYLDNPFEVTP